MIPAEYVVSLEREFLMIPGESLHDEEIFFFSSLTYLYALIGYCNYDNGNILRIHIQNLWTTNYGITEDNRFPNVSITSCKVHNFHLISVRLSRDNKSTDPVRFMRRIWEANRRPDCSGRPYFVLKLGGEIIGLRVDTLY